MARIDEREANGNAWQKPAIAALWAMVLLFGGWAWTDATNARVRIEAGVNELRRDQRK